MPIEWNSNKAILVLFLLFISAFAASSETAFFSLNRFQLRRIRDRYKKSYERIRTLLSRPSRLLVMILLLNEVVNITISSLTTEFLQANRSIFGNHVSPDNEWVLIAIVSTLITLPALLFFGEITPKVIAAKMNRIVAIVNSRILIVLYGIMYPLLWIMDYTISFILRHLKAEGRDHLTKTMSILSEDDFMILMEEGHREGTVNPDERKLIKNVLEFDDSTVDEVMTPITQAFCIPSSAQIGEVMPEIRAQKYSRIPVYQKTKRNIVGVLYVKDLLALHNHPQMNELEVKSLMTRTMFVGPDMRLSVLFRRFKSSKTHMAICVDRNEEAIGVATMEDVLESLFGEIEDERDVR